MVDDQITLENTSKEVTVQIAESDLAILKENKYKLCFAKNVNEEYTVVWQCYPDYLMNNQFSWTTEFLLFGTNQFTPGKKVASSTNSETCDLGNVCTLDKSAVLEPQKPGGEPEVLTIRNKYGLIHSGVKQLLTGIDGKTQLLPVYISKYKQLKGTILLAPKDIVRVWFQQDIKPITTIQDALSEFIELDLTDKASISCLYQDQEWHFT